MESGGWKRGGEGWVLYLKQNDLIFLGRMRGKNYIDLFSYWIDHRPWRFSISDVII